MDITGLLEKNFEERFCARRALHDVWVVKCAPKATEVEPHPDLIDNLRKFTHTNKLKKAAIHIIASQLAENQIKGLRDLFMQMDQNGDGLLTRQELKDGLQKIQVKEPPKDLQDIITGTDCDGSGVVDYTEFLAAAIDKRAFLQEDVCWSAFRVLDKNGDGKVSKAELEGIMHANEDLMTVAEEGSFLRVMEEADKDRDGQIDFAEFMTMMKTPET